MNNAFENITKRRRIWIGSFLFLFLVPLAIEAGEDTNVINLYRLLPAFARGQFKENGDLRADLYNPNWQGDRVSGIKGAFLMVGGPLGAGGKGLSIEECPTVESALLKYAEPGTIGRHQIRLVQQNTILQTPLNAAKDDPGVQAFLAIKLEADDVLIITK